MSESLLFVAKFFSKNTKSEVEKPLLGKFRREIEISSTVRNLPSSVCEKIAPFAPSRFFTVSPNETTRGHTCKLFVCHSRVDVQKYFLCNRVVKIWNSLPAILDDFASIRSFNFLVKRTDLSRFVNF